MYGNSIAGNIGRKVGVVAEAGFGIDTRDSRRYVALGLIHATVAATRTFHDRRQGDGKRPCAVHHRELRASVLSSWISLV
jgi:hypothetical protein